MSKLRLHSATLIRSKNHFVPIFFARANIPHYSQFDQRENLKAFNSTQFDYRPLITVVLGTRFLFMKTKNMLSAT